MGVHREFTRFAQEYRRLNRVQSEVIEHIFGDCYQAPERILDLGCGSGAVANELDWEVKEFVGVDFSHAMLEMHPKDEKIKTLEADFNDESTFERLKEYSFDAVISASALQWAKDLDKIFAHINSLAPNVVLGLFSSNTFRTLHAVAGIDSPIHSQETIIEAANRQFNNPEIQVEMYKIAFKDKKSLFSYIKKSGVSGGERKLGISQMRSLMRDYPLDYLEFEVVYINA